MMVAKDLASCLLVMTRFSTPQKSGWRLFIVSGLMAPVLFDATATSLLLTEKGSNSGKDVDVADRWHATETSLQGTRPERISAAYAITCCLPTPEGEQSEAPTGGQDNVSSSFPVSPRNLSRGHFVGVHSGAADSRNRLTYLLIVTPINDDYDLSQSRVDSHLADALRYRPTLENVVSNEVLMVRKKSRALYPAARGHWGRDLGYDRFLRFSKSENKDAGIWNADSLGD
ncbi:hypothetical protein F4805DRAFT_455523 [Annulohypoxylon moriforme]|nr:hypothetical protein F4805DRAFT_455523 [Annulohypoxylon moriforme]